MVVDATRNVQDGGRTSTWRRPGKGIIPTDDEAIEFQRVGTGRNSRVSIAPSTGARSW